MLIDITVKITPKMAKDAQGNEKKALVGHLGTHFDVMDKEFPLEYTERRGICFDVSAAASAGRDIEISDIDMSKALPGAFVCFFTGFIEKTGYGTPEYFHEHPQLSMELIEALAEKGISIIGIDFAGVRRGKEHTPTDQYCADRGVFIVENLCSLNKILNAAAGQDGYFTASTYPMNYAEISGLPCRVVARI